MEDVTVQHRRLLAAESPDRGRLVDGGLGRRRRRGRLPRACARSCSATRQTMEGSPLANASIDQVSFADGRIGLDRRSLTVGHDRRGHAGRRRRSHRGRRDGEPEPAHEDALRAYTHSASSPRSGSTRSSGRSASRAIVNAVAAGRILNPKTARSQILGGVVLGIGMALHEETFTRPQARPLHEPQHRRVPHPGERRRARHRGRSSSRSTTTR